MKKLLLPLSFISVLGACSHGPGGVAHGNLTPCPTSPNCVSTRAEDPQQAIAPYAYTGGREDTRNRLLRVIAELPRTRIITSTDSYLHVEFRSKIWRFVDDVEFVFDDASQTVQFRSASRLGYSDLGVNRKRMETIRRFYQED